MAAEEADKPRPISAVEGTWPLDEWPVDVQRVDENGIDLSLVEHSLELSPTERLIRVEEFAQFILEIWRRQGLDIDQCINSGNS